MTDYYSDLYSNHVLNYGDISIT